MCQQDSKAEILHYHEPLEIQSVGLQTVYQTVYKKRNQNIRYIAFPQ